MSDRTFNILRFTLLGLLIVWGLYTLIQYLGVPVHQLVLINDVARGEVAQACGTDSMFCAGMRAIFPFIVFTIGRASPFLWYAIWSLIALGALVGMEYLRSAELKIRVRFSPLTILLSFLASLWLMFTVISFGNNGGQPFTQLYEPLPEVYTGSGPEGLFVLQDNFKALKDASCLIDVTPPGQRVGVFHMKHSCMQASFFTKVLPQVLFVLFLTFVFLTLGRFVLQLLRIPVRHPLAEVAFSAGLGSCALIVILWLLALIAYLINVPLYSQVAGWGILIVIPAALYRHARYWLESLIKRSWTYEAPVYAGTHLLAWLLVGYISLNFLNVVRPFPIGWDDLGKYINQPRLLESYGMFIPQLAAYQWEYLTSLGFVLFGYDSVFGATAAMMINWLAGVLAVFAIYAFGRLYLGRGLGLLAPLIYYTLPMVGHFSYADMKVDNAVFLTGALCMLAMFLALFPIADEQEDDEEEPEPERGLPAVAQRDIVENGPPSPAGYGGHPSRSEGWRLVMLAGILGGFAFSLKPTAIMVLMATGTILFGALVHWYAFIGTMALAWAIYLSEDRLNLKEIAGRVYGDPDVLSKPVILGGLVILGLGLTAYAAYLRPQLFKKTSILAGIFIGSFLVTIAPWLMNNNIGYGNVIPRLTFSYPNKFTPSFVINKEIEATDVGQEIRELPPELQVDLTKCVGTSKSEELDRYWGYHTGWGHYLTLPWRSVMNLDSAGYYVTTFPALLLFPLLLLLPYFWSRQGKWLRWLFFGTLFMLVQWMFFANGILWYGIGTFLGLAIGLEALVFRAPDTPTKLSASILIALSILTAYAMRFWQYEQQLNLFEYPLGKVSADAMRERTIPHYDDVREMIDVQKEAMPDRPYVYRVGTFIPYFIPRNLETLPIADHQLDFFNCLYQERDATITLKRLQALGFNSIIFDTNTQTIERDPRGSLHQKVQSFVDFVNTPGLGLSLKINDPGAGIVFITLP